MFYNNNKQFNLSKISSNNLGSFFTESYQNIAKFLKPEKDYWIFILYYDDTVTNKKVKTTFDINLQPTKVRYAANTNQTYFKYQIFYKITKNNKVGAPFINVINRWVNHLYVFDNEKDCKEQYTKELIKIRKQISTVEKEFQSLMTEFKSQLPKTTDANSSIF